MARRRAVLAVLAGATLLGALLTPLTRVGLGLLLLGLAATSAYVALLWQLQRQREIRRRVRHLDRAPAGRFAPAQGHPSAWEGPYLGVDTLGAVDAHGVDADGEGFAAEAPPPARAVGDPVGG